MNIGWEALVIFVLIILNGVFVISEIAVLSSRKARLQKRVNEGDRGADAALKLAQKNADSLGLQDKIDFRQGNLLEPVDGFFDIIVSNPPYIAANEYEELPASVKAFEPREALLAGESGLEFYEKLIYQADGYLQKNGWLLLEIGAKQEAGIRGIIKGSGFYDSIEMRRDYAGLPRVIKARRKVSG